MTESLLTLPKGGGALQGLGETFAPDLHTGTANFSIPIQLPQGRNGLQPGLALSYSSGHGNGPFGLGWSLSVPSVTRKTARGNPRYDDWNDTFLLAGAEDLVPIDEQASTFRPRTEGLFALIEHRRDAGDVWEVRGKDGMLSRYGTRGVSASLPAAAVIVDPAWRADPVGVPRIFAWKLSETVDLFGNIVHYDYLRDTGDYGAHRWDQLYLETIRYADYGDPGAPAFLFTVRLVYAERPDMFSEYRSGFEIRTRLRCERIVVSSHAEGEQVVRRYDLGYATDPHNGVSFLCRVAVVGGDSVESLPPVELGYSAFTPERRRFTPVAAADLPPDALANPAYAFVDLFGSGLSDLMELNGSARYWRNLGGGRFDTPRSMASAPAAISLTDPGVQLIDANGDGRLDLLVTSGPVSGYFSLDQRGGWDTTGFHRYERAPSFSLKDPDVRLLDLDGDGVTDVVRAGETLDSYLNDRRGGWRPLRRLSRGDLDGLPSATFADPHVKWADMTGDGMQDLVLVADGQICYWPNLGYGAWGRRVTMRRAPRLPSGYDPAHVLLGDVDGDGAADLVYIDDGVVTLWINRCGNDWSEPVVIRGTPPATSGDAARLADLHGCGISGVLWSGEVTGLACQPMAFLDFTGGQKPSLLTRVDNNIGAETRVTYAPSTRDYLADQQRPATRWRTTLPFPVQVVATVEVIDRISGGRLRSEFRYHHGYWDGAEREFRGFARVDRLDAETFAPGDEPAAHYAPPTLSKTWFHQGPVGAEAGAWDELDLSAEYWTGDPPRLARSERQRDLLARLPRRVRRDAVRALRGRVLRTELYALDGGPRQERPYTVSESLPDIGAVVTAGTSARLVTSATDLPPDWATEAMRPRIFLPRLIAQRTTQWERGDDPLTQFVFTDDHDAWGQPRQQTSVALPRRQARRAPVSGAIVGTLAGDVVNETRVLATHTRTAYATPDSGLQLADRVAQSYSATLELFPVVFEHAPDDLAQVLADQTAAALATHQQFQALPAPEQAGLGLPPGFVVLSHTANHYDGDAFVGRPLGEVGPYGALTRSEALLITDADLDAAYGAARPAYLGGPAAPAVGVPANFGTDLGYWRVAASDDGHYAGYYADMSRSRFDFQDATAGQRRGMVLARQDARGNATTMTLDGFWLLPVAVTDALGLTTRALHDYRVMRPTQITDPNGTDTFYGYTPLGLLAWQYTRGAAGGGGDAERPDAAYVYDLHAFERTRGESRPQPIFAHARRRVWPASAGVSDDAIEARTYSDGFGRTVQERGQAEALAFGETGDDIGLAAQPGTGDGPAAGQRTIDRVIVSGYKVYDNKGRVVEQYEPFFSEGWAFQPEVEARQGECVTLFYDPRGHVVRTLYPDGSEERVVYGVPPNLEVPDVAAPTPWETYTYDANDLAPVSFGPTGGSLASAAPAEHAFTATSAVADALGRVLCRVTRAGRGAGDVAVLRSAYDVRGQLMTAWDALGRAAVRSIHDLTGRLLRSESIDRGVHVTVFDAMSNQVESRDNRGCVTLRVYDAANRLLQVSSRDHAAAALTLRERIVYATDPDDAAARARGQLGRAVAHYDEAGVVTFNRYDLLGRLQEKRRHVVGDAALRAGWVASWSSDGAEAVLDATAYSTSMRYDGLGRIVQLTYPTDGAGQRAVLTTRYNRAGALEAVQLDGAPYVTQIVYNARGQRALIAYGNRLMTRSVHDPRTGRLVRMRTEASESAAPADDRWVGAGPALEDSTYAYDLVGNLVAMEEVRSGCGIANTPAGRDRLRRGFAHDARYRLTQADGRACQSISGPRSLDDLARCGGFSPPYTPGPPAPNQANAPDLTERYTETYSYDPADNLLAMAYTAPSGSWTRRFGLGDQPAERWQRAASNRLTSLSHGDAIHQLVHDAGGNLIKQNTERHFDWDHANRLIRFRIQPAGAAVASVEARYLYGADGMRVKKWTRRGGVGDGESTVYVDGVFEHRRWSESGSSVGKQHVVLHVMDNQRRIALVRRGDADSRDAAPPIQYHLGDHLDSSSLVVDGQGGWLNREEYYPYGETSFGGFARKRYRYIGKERDEESGLAYHSARYYAPGLARWISPDPAGAADGLNVFQYAAGNPLRFHDRTGLSSSSAPTPPPLPAKGQFGHVAAYTKQGSALYNASGARASEFEHVLSKGMQKAVTFDPATGLSDYTDTHYRNNTTVLMERETSLNKTHANRGGASADNAVTARLKAQAGQGQAINYRAQFTEAIDNAKRATQATSSKVTDAQIHPAALAQDGELFGIQRMNETGAKIGATAAEVDAAIDSLAFEPPARSSASLGSKILSGASKTAEVAGKGMNVVGSLAGGLQVGGGIDKIAQGQTAHGLVDVAEGSANLGLTIGTAAATKAGVLATEAGIVAGGVTMAAGVAAGVAVGLAAESARAAINGEETPIDVADKFYGTHFGDIYGWVTGAYAK